MTKFNQNRVSAVVWPWQEQAAGDDAVRHQIRHRALIQVAVMWGIALLLYFLASRVMAAVVVGISIIVLTTGLWFPKAFRAIHGAMLTFGSWVGTALTWLLMVPFFYLAFVPARVVLILKRKDPLKRSFPSPDETMWVKHDGRRSPEQYERQF